MNGQEQENVFQSIMESQSELKPKQVQNRYSSHSTNAAAETVLNALAELLLIAGLIGGAILIWVGVSVTSIDSHYFSYYWEEGIRTILGISVIIIGVIVIIASIIQWASMKIYINISRNLFNINEFLRKRFGDKEN